MSDLEKSNDRQVPWRLIGMVVALGLLLWFGFANSQKVHVHLFFATREVRLIFVIAISGVLGAAVGWFGARARYRK